MLNIAYVGFGKSTNRYHIPYLMERQDRFKISRVVTPTLGKLTNKLRWKQLVHNFQPISPTF
jgi:predicted dehydrogenase